MAATMRTHRALIASPVALCLLLAGGWTAARAAEPTALGQCIAVRSPLTTEEVSRILEVSNSVLNAAPQRTAVKLVYDFNPGNASASSAKFGPCYDLAKYLLSLHDVTTIAFVHGEVTRHSVLPVLACKELVMSADGKLGPVTEDGGPLPEAAEKDFYLRVVQGRGISAAVVLKLLYPDLEVLKGNRQGAVVYFDAARKAEEIKKGVVVNDDTPVLPRGRVSYTVDQAEHLGLCRRKLDSLQAVVREYDLPRTALREDSLIGRTPVAWKTTVSGPVTGSLDKSLRRHIRRAIGSPDRHANVIVLELDCSGGDPAVAQRLAEWLHGLKDDKNELPVKTIAFVRGPVTGTATLLALGCSEIVLARSATIGDLSAVAQADGRSGAEAPADDNKDGLLLQQVKALAEDQGYPIALVRAMAYPNFQVYAVESAGKQRRFWVVTQAELDADARRNRDQDRLWKNAQLVQSVAPAGKPLVLDAPTAEKVRLSRYTVDDLPSLFEHYGIKPDQVRTGGRDWLDEFAYVLRLPAMSVFLILLGATCLVLELKMPGLGLPGVIAALCFVLFFWSNAHDAGITLLAILLFVLGLVLIGLEVFLVPGSAVFGISGVVLLIGSLTLVTIDRWPQTSHEWVDLGGTLATFTASLAGAVVAAMVLAWYLPHIPYVNRLILKPPGEGPADELGLAQAPAPGQPDMAALLGAIGVAATPLRPAGKVKFGDDYVDVVAEGSYVQPGARVQVIEIEGYRVVVKEV
jgi:membrane-bound serine protease (ClpP class)